MGRLGHIVVLSVMVILAPIPLHGNQPDPGTGTSENSDTGETEARATQTGRRFEAWFIDGLPIIGHQYQDVLVLTAGVVDPDGDGNPNVHGAPATGLQYRLEGGDVTDPGFGTFGFNINPLIIEEIDMITAGAPAEYGRAGGGFADITTRSGGNDFSGRFSVYWRGSFLDGDDAGNSDINTYDREFDSYRDTRPALSLGGPILKDRLWYFVSTELIDAEEPVRDVFFDAEIESRAVQSFGKLTLQGNPSNKASLYAMWEDRTDEGLGLSFFTNSAEPSFDHERDGYTVGLNWISHLSPTLLLETNISHMDVETSITPASENYEPFAPTFIIDTRVTPNVISMRYPCRAVNCSPLFGEKRTYRIDGLDWRIDGPYFTRKEDVRTRSELKSMLSYAPPDAWGSHDIKAGFEVTEEELGEEASINPRLFDLSFPASSPFSPPFAVAGWQIVTAPDSLESDREASSTSTGFFIQDSWKPLDNLTINAGLRLDWQELETLSLDFVDPQEERREAIDIWWAFCEEADRQLPFISISSNCNPNRPYDGEPPRNIPNNSVRSFLDADMDGVNDVPPEVAALDLNGDGFINVTTNDRQALFRKFTLPSQRISGDFAIENTDLSPRIGIAWDPWSDGKTRLFAHWGRYYDRILLSSAIAESGPSFTNSSFLPDATTMIFTQNSVSVAGSDPTIAQIDPDIETPRTDELSLGFEREVANDWSFGVTYIRTKGYDLLREADTNHYTCLDASRAIGVPPVAVCGNINGNLRTDVFGTLTSDLGFPPPTSQANGLTDLYTFSANFNKVLTIDNRAGFDYEAYEILIRKRMHRNWQMEASYTRSESTGQPSDRSALDAFLAEEIDDDTPLDSDRRHVFKLQAVTRLPHGIALGAAVRYESGTPYSTVGRIFEEDSSGNHDLRLYLPSGELNDERNEGIWRIDGRVEKGFKAGGADISGYFLAENLLDSDDLTIREAYRDVDSPAIDAYRDPGRRFEIGAIIDF